MRKLFLLSGCLLTGCSATKWVDDPFHYVPRNPSDVWVPPCEEKVPLNMAPLSNGRLLSLAELIDVGLLNSPLTQKSWAMARNAAATYTQSMSTDFPQLDISVSSTRSRVPDYFGRPPLLVFYQTLTQPELTLSYTLLDFGERKATTDAMREALYNANWTHNQQIQDLIQTISLDYYSYLYQLEQLKANEADLEDAHTSLEAAQEKFDRGVADLSDVLQARSQYLQQLINLTNQKQNVENAFVTLATDTGLPANHPFTVMRFPGDPGILKLEEIDELLEIASSHRPDLMAAEANVLSKEASLKAAKINLLPTVALNGDVGRTYYGTLNDRYDFSVGLTFSYPLFHGFYLKNAVRIAKANLEAAEADLEQAKLGVMGDVVRYRSNLHFSYENLGHSENYLKAAEEEFKVTLKQYKLRVVTIVDLLNAQATLADARAKKALSWQNWFDALANMAHGTGTLYAPENCICR